MSKVHEFAIVAFVSLLATTSVVFGQEFKKEQYNKYSEFANNGFSEVVTVSGPMKLIFLSGMLVEIDVIAAVAAK